MVKVSMIQISYFDKKDWDSLEEMEERAFSHQQQRNCYLQAFTDWMGKRSFPI